MTKKEDFKFTREWFQDKKNQVHTRQDIDLFNDREYPKENIIEIGEHFLVDLIPVDDKCSDVEIWEVENTKKKHGVLRRGKLPLKPIRKITTGKQFGFPNGYWRVPETKDQQNLEKGCENRKAYYSPIEHKWLKCGERLNGGNIVYCSECQEKINSKTDEEKEQAIKRIEKNMPDNWRLNIG